MTTPAVPSLDNLTIKERPLPETQQKKTRSIETEVDFDVVPPEVSLAEYVSGGGTEVCYEDEVVEDMVAEEEDEEEAESGESDESDESDDDEDESVGDDDLTSSYYDESSSKSHSVEPSPSPAPRPFLILYTTLQSLTTTHTSTAFSNLSNPPALPPLSSLDHSRYLSFCQVMRSSLPSVSAGTIRDLNSLILSFDHSSPLSIPRELHSVLSHVLASAVQEDIPSPELPSGISEEELKSLCRTVRRWWTNDSN